MSKRKSNGNSDIGMSSIKKAKTYNANNNSKHDGPTLKFGDIEVGGNNKVFFIGEAGINHNGSVETAKKLIDLAKRCGCDAVKFQKRTVNRILTKEGLNNPYVNKNSFGPTYGEHKAALELSEESFRELKAYSDQVGILFTASGWDEEAVDFLYDLGVPFFKMASADLTNFPLLEHTAKKGRPMILSTGMADMETVKAALAHVHQWNHQVALLQCTSSYPTTNEDIHLNVIKTYQKEFPKTVIGFSGHEKGISISLAATVLGAKIVERHFTLDRTMKGGDHAASLEEGGLHRLIRDIAAVRTAMGGYEKKRWPAEEAPFKKLAKSIVSTVPIKKGTVIKREHLTTKGPGSGINPMKMNEVVGLKAAVDMEEDIVIHDHMVSWKK